MSDQKPSPAQVMAALRLKALTEAPSTYRRAPGCLNAGAVMVMMETRYDSAVVSVVAFVDGAASIYFSSGGGVIGGESHRTVNIAARRFSQFAGMHIGEMEKCETFPLPAPGQTTFYVAGQQGMFTLSATEEDLGTGNHEFSPLFHLGQHLITQLRQVSEQEQ